MRYNAIPGEPPIVLTCKSWHTPCSLDKIDLENPCKDKNQKEQCDELHEQRLGYMYHLHLSFRLHIVSKCPAGREAGLGLLRV